MINPLMGMGNQIIKVRLDNVLNVMESKIHFLLKGSPYIFQSKEHFSVRKGTPRTNKILFMLVFWLNLDFILLGKTIHKRKNFTLRTSINDLIYERCGVIVLGTCLVQVTEICAYMYCTLFLINGNMIGHPFRQSNWEDETRFQLFFHFSLNSCRLTWVNTSKISLNRFGIGIGSYFMFNNWWIYAWCYSLFFFLILKHFLVFKTWSFFHF